MTKWILLLAIVYIAYRYWSRMSVIRSPQQSPPKVEEMLECAQCGLRFPEGEAVCGDGKVFCSHQHCQSWLQGR